METVGTGIEGLRACNFALQSWGGAYRVDCPDPGGFRGRIRSVRVGLAVLTDVELAHCIVRRNLESGIFAPESYNLILQREGDARMRQCGSEACLVPGDLTIIDTRFSSEFEAIDGFRQLALTVPAAPIRNLMGSSGVPVARSICGSSPAGRVLADLLISCHCNSSGLEDVDMIGAITQLFAAALGRRQVGGCERGHGTPDLVRIERFIDAHLDQDGLSPSLLARQFGMSVRQLYRLTSTAGCTPSALIWSRRLERARRLLNEERSDARVLDVALSCGFKDGAHFSRAFRRTYGSSPREARSNWGLHRRAPDPSLSLDFTRIPRLEPGLPMTAQSIGQRFAD